MKTNASATTRPTRVHIVLQKCRMRAAQKHEIGALKYIENSINLARLSTTCLIQPSSMWHRKTSTTKKLFIPEKYSSRPLKTWNDATRLVHVRILTLQRPHKQNE